MSLASFALILSGVLLNAVAQLFLKAGTNALGQLNFSRSEAFITLLRISTEPHILSGLFCYFFSVAIWIMALSRVPVSIAYPMLSIGYIVNAIASWYLLNELLSVQKLAGIGIIIIGVILIARS